MVAHRLPLWAFRGRGILPEERSAKNLCFARAFQELGQAGGESIGVRKHRALESLPWRDLALVPSTVRRGRQSIWVDLANEVLERDRSKRKGVVGSQNRLDRSVGIREDSTPYALLLRRCANARDLLQGKWLHARMRENGNERDRYLGNLLVEMYGKCGALEDAFAVFSRIRRRNVFSWTNMIAAYAQHGEGKKALQLFQQMQLEGVIPDKFTYVSVLSACAAQAALAEGKTAHACIVDSGFESDVVVATAVVNMYGKCGRLEDARKTFDKMPERNGVSWTAMIAAYTHTGNGKQALQLFQQMQLEGVIPDKITFISVLSACASHGCLQEGKLMHARLVDGGFESDATVGIALVNMYGKCGSLENAQAAFDKIPKQNAVPWNSMMVVYTDLGHAKQAIQLFQQMQQEGVIPDKATFIAILSACASQAALAEGRRMQELIVHSGFELDVVVGTALVSMYGKCGSVVDAQRTFDKIPKRDLISWNAMIAAYVWHGQGKKALQLFQQMQLEGVIPDNVTFVSVLSACASEAWLSEGKLLHAHIVAYGFKLDVAAGTALVNMYCNCGLLEDALKVFDKIPERNVVSWTILITAYAQHGKGTDALQLLLQMQVEGVIPNNITFLNIFSAFACHRALPEGKLMHAHILGGRFKVDVGVGTALVIMYGKCGSLRDAHRTFDQILEQDIVLWNAMMAVYSWYGHGKEVLQLFEQLLLEGMVPDKVTFVNALSACAHHAALVEGKRMHVSIVASGFESDVVVGTALVNMYGKCGSLGDAWSAFDKMLERNVVSWNAMITACAQHGHGKDALQLFQQMQLEGVLPNHVTFVSILSACSHAGLVEEGCHYFVSMNQDHAMAPTLEHYNCLIDLLGRAGQLDEVVYLIEKMPCDTTAMTWMTLLSACRMHFDVERGKLAAEHIFDLDLDDAVPYVLLSNIYAAAGSWDDAVKVRKMMNDKGLKKQAGCSCIEIRNKVHEFFVGDDFHPQKEEIYAELQKLSRQMEEAGYVPCTNLVLHDVEVNKKELILSHHSEKLAIAFGLINTHPGTTLRITNNLRMCPDCHSTVKFITRISHREIILRDANRFHHFRDGTCSCADYW